MKIAIRVDGSPFIGMGHLVRSLALAAAFRKAGHEIVFLSRFEPGISRIREAGFPVRPFQAGLPDGPDKEYEAAGDGQAVLDLLQQERADCLVTDSYRVDAAYFECVRQETPTLVYVDDLNRFPVNVDIVVNGNIYGGDMDYSWLSPSTLKLLGCQYNLLRSEFCDSPEFAVRKTVTDILLTGGGGDPGPLLVFLAERLLMGGQFPGCRLHLVAPAAAAELLQGLAARYPQVIPHFDVRQMAELMSCCDLAISAGGTTLYELCAVGVPRLAYILADNQQDIVATMDRGEYIVNLGWIQDLTAERLTQAALDLADNQPIRRLMSSRGRILVDGRGSERVVAAIVGLGNGERGGLQ